MKTVTLKNYHLPTVQDGLDGLLEMAEIFGESELLAFLSMGYSPGSPIGQTRQILAARLVASYMKRNKDVTYSQARLAVAHDQGYFGTHSTNFTNRMANPGRELLRERGEWPFDPSRDV